MPVETVRGPVEASQLGRTLMHEHIFVMTPEWLYNWSAAFGPNPWDEDERVADAIAKLSAVRDAGIRTVVDATAPPLGRNVARIQRVNEGVDLNIIVASGVYSFLEAPNFLAYRQPDAIAKVFVRELTEQINDTGVRAGFLKCAVEQHGLIGDIPKLLEAVAIAARETGAPVMVHTNAEHRTGLDALTFLTEHGVDPARIVIAHAGDSNDLDYLDALAGAGAWLGLDRFGIDHFNPLASRIETLIKLLGRGYGDRLHLSHDAACFIDFMIGDPFFANEKPDYLLLTREVLPQLLAAGVSQEQIDQLMVANPMSFFG